MTGRGQIRRTGAGTLVFALLLIFVGGYYLLRNTLGIDLPELDSDQVVPVLAVIFGCVLLYRAWRDDVDRRRAG